MKRLGTQQTVFAITKAALNAKQTYYSPELVQLQKCMKTIVLPHELGQYTFTSSYLSANSVRVRKTLIHNVYLIVFLLLITNIVRLEVIRLYSTLHQWKTHKCLLEDPPAIEKTK